MTTFIPGISSARSTAGESSEHGRDEAQGVWGKAHAAGHATAHETSEASPTGSRAPADGEHREEAASADVPEISHGPAAKANGKRAMRTSADGGPSFAAELAKNVMSASETDDHADVSAEDDLPDEQQSAPAHPGAPAELLSRAGSAGDEHTSQHTAGAAPSTSRQTFARADLPRAVVNGSAETPKSDAMPVSSRVSTGSHVAADVHADVVTDVVTDVVKDFRPSASPVDHPAPDPAPAPGAPPSERAVVVDQHAGAIPSFAAQHAHASAQVPGASSHPVRTEAPNSAVEEHASSLASPWHPATPDQALSSERPSASAVTAPVKEPREGDLEAEAQPSVAAQPSLPVQSHASLPHAVSPHPDRDPLPAVPAPASHTMSPSLPLSPKSTIVTSSAPAGQGALSPSPSPSPSPATSPARADIPRTAGPVASQSSRSVARAGVAYAQSTTDGAAKPTTPGAAPARATASQAMPAAQPPATRASSPRSIARNDIPVETTAPGAKPAARSDADTMPRHDRRSTEAPRADFTTFPTAPFFAGHVATVPATEGSAPVAARHGRSAAGDAAPVAARQARPAAEAPTRGLAQGAPAAPVARTAHSGTPVMAPAGASADLAEPAHVDGLSANVRPGHESPAESSHQEPRAAVASSVPPPFAPAQSVAPRRDGPAAPVRASAPASGTGVVSAPTHAPAAQVAPGTGDVRRHLSPEVLPSDSLSPSQVPTGSDVTATGESTAAHPTPLVDSSPANPPLFRLSDTRRVQAAHLDLAQQSYQPGTVATSSPSAKGFGTDGKADKTRSKKLRAAEAAPAFAQNTTPVAPIAAPSAAVPAQPVAPRASESTAPRSSASAVRPTRAAQPVDTIHELTASAPATAAAVPGIHGATHAHGALPNAGRRDERFPFADATAPAPRDVAPAGDREGKRPEEPSRSTAPAAETRPASATAVASDKAHAPVPTPAHAQPAAPDASPAPQAPVAGPQAPLAAQPLYDLATADHSLHATALGQNAHLHLDAGAAGPLSLHLTVRDGVADLEVEGPAVERLKMRPEDLRRALAGEGLTLGHFASRVNETSDTSAQRDGTSARDQGNQSQGNSDRASQPGEAPRPTATPFSAQSGASSYGGEQRRHWQNETPESADRDRRPLAGPAPASASTSSSTSDAPTGRRRGVHVTA